MVRVWEGMGTQRERRGMEGMDTASRRVSEQVSCTNTSVNFRVTIHIHQLRRRRRSRCALLPARNAPRRKQASQYSTKRALDVVNRTRQCQAGRHRSLPCHARGRRGPRRLRRTVLRRRLGQSRRRHRRRETELLVRPASLAVLDEHGAVEEQCHEVPWRVQVRQIEPPICPWPVRVSCGSRSVRREQWKVKTPKTWPAKCE